MLSMAGTRNMKNGLLMLNEKMKPTIKHFYIESNLKQNFNLDYDKQSIKRPAWIEVKGLCEGIRLLSIEWKNKLYVYQAFLTPILFLPIDSSKEEMRLFYDRWAKTYDDSVIRTLHGNAAEFLVSLLAKYKVRKNIDILDLCSGTGILDEALVRKGYNNITLIDYSEEMLNEARKKVVLTNCNFVKQDVTNLNLKKRYDMITGMFGFGSSSKEDVKILFRILDKYLKKKGLFLMLGHFKSEELDLSKKLKKIEAGEYELSSTKHEKRFLADYFLGIKK